MTQPLLEGEQQYAEDSQEVQQLRADLRELSRKLEHAELEARHTREDMARVLQRLREMTLPFLQLLRAIHGEIDAVAPVSNPPAPVAPQFDPRWEAWKQQLGVGTAPARVIDALLTHGPLNRTQLREAGELGWSSLDAATSRLKNLSLVEKVGDRWRLKPL